MIFNISTIGASHVKNGTTCQDYSLTWTSDNGKCFALIACDGHGSSTHVRSHIGARLAAEAALDIIKLSLQSTPDWLGHTRGAVTARDPDEDLRYDTSMTKDESEMTEIEKQEYRQRCLFVEQVRGLHDQDTTFVSMFEAIYKKWHTAIEQDFRNNPFTDKERTLLGNNTFVRAYGTTLMAYVQTPAYWYAFHIGDGRLLACNPMMEWRQIVPWDTNCFQNVTTSLCNSNPVPLFRYAFDATGHFPAAVFCCSDGIEDSWGDYDVAPHLLHDYLSLLLQYFVEHGEAESMQKLKEFLPLMSEKGSHDDMTIAAYINSEAVAPGIEYHHALSRRKAIEERIAAREKDLEATSQSVVQMEQELAHQKQQLAQKSALCQQEDESDHKAILAIDRHIAALKAHAETDQTA